LVAWEKLDDDTKENHRKRVNNIPLLLAKIGYEVYKLNKG
jgi:hypothetical protein